MAFGVTEQDTGPAPIGNAERALAAAFPRFTTDKLETRK